MLLHLCSFFVTLQFLRKTVPIATYSTASTSSVVQQVNKQLMTTVKLHGMQVHVQYQFQPSQYIIIIIIIKNVLIRVTLHTKVLQGHFTQLTQKHCRSCGTKATD